MKYRLWLALGAALCLEGCDLATRLTRPPKVALPAHFSDSSGAAARSPAGNGGADSAIPGSTSSRPRSTPPIPISPPRSPMTGPPRPMPTPRPAACSPRSISTAACPTTSSPTIVRCARQNQPTYYGANQVFARHRRLRARRLGTGARSRQGGAAPTRRPRAMRSPTRGSNCMPNSARDYIELRGLDAEAKLLADTTKLYASALNSTRDRLNAKIAPPIDEQRALTELNNVEAEASDLGAAPHRAGGCDRDADGQAGGGFPAVAGAGADGLSAPAARDARRRAAPAPRRGSRRSERRSPPGLWSARRRRRAIRASRSACSAARRTPGSIC